VAAKYVLAVLSSAFLIAGSVRLGRDGGNAHPQSRTWLFIGVMFGVVSGWLFWQG
jgi:hypothetical protein